AIALPPRTPNQTWSAILAFFSYRGGWLPDGALAPGLGCGPGLRAPAGPELLGPVGALARSRAPRLDQRWSRPPQIHPACRPVDAAVRGLPAAAPAALPAGDAA